MNRVEIRAAELADLAVLVEVSERTIRACYTPFLGVDAVEGWISAGEVQSYFEASLPRCKVLCADSSVAGFSAVDGALVELMMIDAARQRQGLGARLLAETEAGLFREHPVIRLESFVANARANAFYRAMGWHQGEHFVDAETGIDMMHFSKRRA